MLPSVVEFCVFGYLGGLVLVHHASLFLVVLLFFRVGAGAGARMLKVSGT